MHLSVPFESAGFSRLLASSVPPLAAPAPISVCISSINKIASGRSASCFITAFKRCSKSPLYLVPASNAPISSEYTVAFANISGISLPTMRLAKPSAMAVLPTPASPTSSGLFLRRRHKVCMTRSSSGARPISGSILPAATCAFRLRVNCSKAPVGVPSASTSDSAPSGFESPSGIFATPCEIKFTTSKRVMPCWCKKNTACESFSP